MKVYLIYLNDELYGYTSNQKMYKEFKSTRRKFYKYKKKELTKTEFCNINKNYSEMVLQYLDNSFKLPVTYSEKISTINEANSVVYINIYLQLLVNPAIFTDKIYDILNNIRYTDIYSVFGEIGDPIDEFEPDYIKYFIYRYNKLLDISNVLKLYGGKNESL